MLNNFLQQTTTADVIFQVYFFLVLIGLKRQLVLKLNQFGILFEWPFKTGFAVLFSRLSTSFSNLGSLELKD